MAPLSGLPNFVILLSRLYSLTLYKFSDGEKADPHLLPTAPIRHVFSISDQLDKVVEAMHQVLIVVFLSASLGS